MGTSKNSVRFFEAATHCLYDGCKNDYDLAALAEGDSLLTDPKALRFSSVEDLFAELNT